MIQIKCKGSSTAKLSEMILIQGDLKELPHSSYEKLRLSLLTDGLICPFFLWTKQRGVPKKKEVLDGTQRHITLNRMKDEGETIPDNYPVVDIDAPDLKTAKKMILLISSNYGKTTEESIKEYIRESGIGIEDIQATVEMDAVDVMGLSFDVAVEDVPEEKEFEGKSVEVDIDAMEAKLTECPSCKFKF